MLPTRDDHFSLGSVEGKPEQLSMDLSKPAKGVSFLRGGARRYAARQGLSYDPSGLDEMQADSGFQSKVARTYETAASTPTDQRIAGAYKALAHEVGQQYDYLTKPRTAGGLGVNVQFEPELDNTKLYPTHRHMMADIQQNRRLRVNQTGSDPNDQAVGHPFLTPEQNDQFRAVHDAFGHAAIGRSFSRHGEEAAFHSHMQMFSPAALPALAVETRMQNSALNYGRNQGVFPAQKTFSPPDWALKNRLAR